MAHRWRTADKNSPAARATKAGYNQQHKQIRDQRLRTTTPHDLCGYCHKPLGPERLPGDKRSRWHLPHNRTRTGYLPGMWHATCNTREGAIEGNRRQRATQRATRGQRVRRAQHQHAHSRDW